MFRFSTASSDTPPRKKLATIKLCVFNVLTPGIFPKAMERLLAENKALRAALLQFRNEQRQLLFKQMENLEVRCAFQVSSC
jgi:hypothetical protein